LKIIKNNFIYNIILQDKNKNFMKKIFYKNEITGFILYIKIRKF